MDMTDRGRVIRALRAVSDSTADGSCTSDDMAAYTHRLIKHLLGSLETDMPEQPGSKGPEVSAALPAPPATWAMPSTQQIIQEQLWHPGLFDLPQPQVPIVLEPQGQQQQQPQQGQQHQNPPASNGDLLFPAADDDIWKLLFPM